MKFIRPEFRFSVTSTTLLTLVAVALLGTGCASVDRVAGKIKDLTGEVGHAAGQVREASRDAQQATDDLKQAIPGKGSAALPPPPSPTAGTPASNPDLPAADEVSEDADSTGGEEGDVLTEAPDSDPGPATSTNPPAPVVKARLVIEAESPLECIEGQQVVLSCRVTTPTGTSVAGVGVIFHVTDSAGGRDLGTARTGSDGVASRLYRPSFNFRGRRSSAVLKYVTRIEDSRRWYATRDAGQITFLRADSGQ